MFLFEKIKGAFKGRGMKKLVEKEFTREQMKLMEMDIIHHHNQGIFGHAAPTVEENEDAYWSHIVWDWAGINYGIDDPEQYPLHEPYFYKKVILFLYKNRKALVNKEGDAWLLLLFGRIVKEFMEVK